MRTYFAYGSNMSGAAMSAACPDARFLGRARAPGYRLAFTRRSVRTGSGVADLVAEEGRSAWGVLYEVSDANLASLDRKEGAGWAYERRESSVLADDETAQPAVAYIVIAKSSEEIPPSRQYARDLVAAARERGLPPDYVRALADVEPQDGARETA